MMEQEAPSGKSGAKVALKTADKTLRCVAVMEAGDTLLIAANNFFVTKDLLKTVSSKQENFWNSKTTIKNNINKGDPIAQGNQGLFDIFSDTSADARERFDYDRALFVTGRHTYMNNYHAEMQILQFMLDYGMKAKRRYIGVSKPCCPECAAVLIKARITFAEGHTKNAHGVRNVQQAGFTHPHFASNLADRIGTGTLSKKGFHEAPF